eukprot:1161463-Pelagomonas_calceolata.AAC.10
MAPVAPIHRVLQLNMFLCKDEGDALTCLLWFRLSTSQCADQQFLVTLSVSWSFQEAMQEKTMT